MKKSAARRRSSSASRSRPAPRKRSATTRANNQPAAAAAAPCDAEPIARLIGSDEFRRLPEAQRFELLHVLALMSGVCVHR